MPDPLPTLDALGRLNGTDKASHGHDYLAFYERFFEPLRHGRITFLEVGIAAGESRRPAVPGTRLLCAETLELGLALTTALQPIRCLLGLRDEFRNTDYTLQK